MFIVLLSVFFLFISCNNDDASSIPIEEANYYALTTGNNWKYEYFMRVYPTTKVFETLGIIEEVEILETTLINEEIYFVFQRTTTGNNNNSPCAPENGITTVIKRYSLEYLIDSNLSILFSNENLNDYLISENI